MKKLIVEWLQSLITLVIFASMIISFMITLAESVSDPAAPAGFNPALSDAPYTLLSSPQTPLPAVIASRAASGFSSPWHAQDNDKLGGPATDSANITAVSPGQLE
ncbi:MAG: hypothetical protein VR65_10730 [Desulfobulbaceae bacterium BRH_c16a]|nr:MAG: hypothetical protein VR65_10730 [Desulfobulbaceae bacterium BRH_c16a]